MYKLIVAVIVLTAMFKTYCRYQDGHLSRLRFLALCLIWSGILLFGFVPVLSDKLARLLGTSEGANLFFFFSIVFLLYVMLGMNARIEKLQQDITALVRSQSINEYKQTVAHSPTPKNEVPTNEPDAADS